MDQNNQLRNNEIFMQSVSSSSSSQQQQLQDNQQQQQSSTLNQQDLQALQNSQAFRQLQKQIQKMRKYYLSIGYSQKQVSDMLHDILLRKQSQEIDWKKLSNTSDYYTVLERYNSTSEIAESALKFKKEINQMKSLCKNISQNCAQQRADQQQQGEVTKSNFEERKLDEQNNNIQSLFTLSSKNIFNDQQQNLQKESTNLFTFQNSNNFQCLTPNENNVNIQTKASTQKINNQDKKEIKKGFDVNEISDRFLYRLDRNCSIERSSSSSESGDQDSYHYKINNGFIQSEHDFEQQALKNQAVQLQKGINKNNDQANNLTNGIINNDNNLNNQYTKQKQTFSQNIRNNYPDVVQGLYGNTSSEHIQAIGRQSSNNLQQNNQQFEDKNLEYHNNDYSNGIQEESYHSYSNEQSITSHQKKKKIRKQKGLQQQIPSILEQNDILVDLQKKKICRGIQFRDDISNHKHNYAGKKRNHKYINQYQVQDNNEFQDFPDLDDLQLLEKKFRYFAENDFIDDDQPSQQ